MKRAHEFDHLDDYQAEAMRTRGDLEPPGAYALAALGLCGEAGELAEKIKKHLFHGHDLPWQQVAEELGDILWYMAFTAETFGLSLGEIAKLNLAKLLARYPDGFSEEASRNRKGDDT
jgi:NTP pyrophosphatase (non-canonical NTP hydrolase)